jgi:hypothetical protein
VSGEAEVEDVSSLPVRKLLQCLDWVFEWAINGIPGADGVEDLARSYSSKAPTADDAIDTLISLQIAKASTAGFITGIGGVVTLPVAIPTNLRYYGANPWIFLPQRGGRITT